VAGTRKGIPNKIGSAVKSNVLAVFDKIGGRDKMCDWAQANLTEFYRLYARLIPSEINTTVDFRDVTELSRSELLLIASGSSQRASEERSGEGDVSGVH
jgi:hypothetical protein